MHLKPIHLILPFFLQLGSSEPMDNSFDEEQRSCTLYSRHGVPIQGINNVTIKGASVEFCSFYRIPYARPPVKKFRFQKAKMVRLFNVRSKPRGYKSIPPECTQQLGRDVIAGQEDCLFANVFTRQGARDKVGNSSRLMPVVLWIHGGTFAMGSGLSDDFNPGAFIEQDIVVVSFNYRLDIFGFYPVTPDEPYSMNLGLEDQKVVLQWVQKHIKLFGGDPNRVTVLGWSAGSASVNYLMYDVEAKGLFHSAIAMSGSFLSPWAFTFHPHNFTQLLCEVHKVGECNLKEMVSRFGVQFKNLILPNSYHATTTIWGTAFPYFAPTPAYPGDSPELRMRVGPVNDVPLLTGVVSNETKTFKLGTFAGFGQSSHIFANNDRRVIGSVEQMLQRVARESRQVLMEHLSMADMYYGSYKFIELHEKRTEKSLFFYQFNHNPEGTGWGAAHGDDIKLLFRAYNDRIPGNAHVAATMEKLWTNFIKFK